LASLKSSRTRRQSALDIAYRQKVETLELFVKAIAHELNAPLTGISLSLQSLKKISKNHLQFQQGIFALERDLGAAVDLLEELKSLNRRESFRPTLLNLQHEIQTVVSPIQADMKSMIDISLNLPEEKIFIWGDSNRLKRVFINIIKNVQEESYCQTNGCALAIRITQSRTWIKIQFTDSAGGIAKSDLPLLFNPYFTRKGRNNKGLGLFIAQKIIREHGGMIRITSRTPHTRVTIYLPLR